MKYLLVRNLAAAGVPVAVICRVLGFSKQAFYQWCVNPLSAWDWDDAHLINAAYDVHADDPVFAGICSSRMNSTSPGMRRQSVVCGDCARSNSCFPSRSSVFGRDCTDRTSTIETPEELFPLLRFVLDVVFSSRSGHDTLP